MGSLVWSADMMIQDYMQTMLRAEQFGKWETAAQCLFNLSKFLIGYGQGLDIPAPPKISFQDANDIRHRINTGSKYMTECQKYYRRYSPDIMERIGLYISDIMTKLTKANNPYAY